MRRRGGHHRGRGLCLRNIYVYTICHHSVPVTTDERAGYMGITMLFSYTVMGMYGYVATQGLCPTVSERLAKQKFSAYGMSS